MNRLNKYYLANGYYLLLVIKLVSFSKLRCQITPLYLFLHIIHLTIIYFENLMVG